MLEGSKEKVLKTFEKISVDDRHVEVEVLIQRTARNRLFPNWAMKDDPVESWMWSQTEVAEGAVLRSSQNEIMSVFRKVAGNSDNI